jgi:hypothetical protein
MQIKAHIHIPHLSVSFKDDAVGCDTYTHTHIYIHTYTYIYIHTHTYTHTHVAPVRPPLG